MADPVRVTVFLSAVVLLAGACAQGTVEPSATPIETVTEQGAAPTEASEMGQEAQVELGPDAVTTASGLRYEDVVAGEGAPAGRCEVATVHYSGTLTDGTQFDSSYDRGVPFVFVLGAGQVIRGWDEGVEGMRVGGKRRLVVPSDLGYGPSGSQTIPPNATLVFDVELLDVSGPPPAMPDAPAQVQAYETTDSGLQYAVLREGEGPEASTGQQVYVHYTGWLEDGTSFDSSLGPDRCGPLSFALGSGKVIRGWDEGVTGMKVGEQRQLRIPPDLAYGASGSGPIPPDSVLVFDVELVSAR